MFHVLGEQLDSSTYCFGLGFSVSATLEVASFWASEVNGSIISPGLIGPRSFRPFCKVLHTFIRQCLFHSMFYIYLKSCT